MLFVSFVVLSPTDFPSVSSVLSLVQIPSELASLAGLRRPKILAADLSAHLPGELLKGPFILRREEEALLFHAAEHIVRPTPPELGISGLARRVPWDALSPFQGTSRATPP